MKDVWRVKRYTLPDGPATLARLPGVAEAGPANTALFTAARRIEGERVFVAGPGAIASALWAARAGAKVVFWTDSIAEGESLKATFTHNSIDVAFNVFGRDRDGDSSRPAPHTIYVQDDFSALSSTCCQLALLHLPRGNALQRALFGVAAAMLAPGSRLVFVGAKKEGVRSALKQAQMIFGHAGIVARKGGYHAGIAQRPQEDFALPKVTYTDNVVHIDGVPSHLLTCPGVFAAGRLDGGAAALIQGMQIAARSRVLDLGCGAGVAGLAALRRGADGVLSDVSARAVASTRKTLAANGYPNVPVHLTWGAQGLQRDSFDVVITNPPFHRGHGTNFEVAQLFVQHAARVLRAGGALYLVANHFLPYAPWLKANFNQVNIAWEDKAFRVWHATQ